MTTAFEKEFTHPAVATLGVKVASLEDNMRDIKTTMGSLATEMRASFNSVSFQLAEKQKTPWMVVFGAATVLITILGFFGTQALSPIQAEIQFLKSNIVTRAEHDYRTVTTNEKFNEVQRHLDQVLAVAMAAEAAHQAEQRDELNHLRAQLLAEKH